MRPELTYREYRPGDEKEIIPLLTKAFNGWPSFDLSCSLMDHWRWKYVDNPYKMTLTSVALHGDRIIGVSCQYPTKIKIGGEWMTGAYSCDLAVDSKYRNLGVSKMLIEQNIIQRKGYGFNLTFFVTSNPHLIQSYSRDYLEFPYRIANMVRIMDINKHQKNMPVKKANLIKLGYNTLKLFNRAKTLIQKKYEETPVRTHASDEVDSFFDKLLTENSGYKFLLDKSPRFLSWRFLDPRSGNFSLKYSQDDGGSGYIAVGLNRYKEEYPIGYIVDILATPGRNDIVYGLIKSAVDFFDRLNVNIVSGLITKHHPYEKLLAQFGFLDSRIKLHLYTNLNHLNKSELIMNHSPDEIHFTYAGIDSLPSGPPEYAFN